MYSPFGMYGYNPNYTLAETPYARMTGMLTPMSEQMLPGTASYLQPMFVDMNSYYGNTGIPRYPSFIGGMAMQNPQIPIMQPNQIGAGQQPQMYGMQQPQMFGMQQPQMFGMQQPQMFGMQQPQMFGMQQPTVINNIVNNFFGQPTMYGQSNIMQQQAQTSPIMNQGAFMPQMQNMMQILFSLFLGLMGNMFNSSTSTDQ